METFGNDFQPDSENVSEIRSINYLIEKYPNENLIPQFKRLQETYPCYRAIRGDGNCFYRAIAFLYLREVDLSTFSKVFEEIENYCVEHSLYFEDITFKEKLKVLYNKDLKPLRDTFGETREKELAECFNNSTVFDMMMIMYFRSLNYKYIREHEQDFISFVASRDTIERVRRYGMDSEGIEYESMAKALKVQIEMKITDESQVKSEVYNNMDRSNTLFEIFFRPGHFDLLYHKNSPYLERFLNRRQDIYSNKVTPQIFDGMKYFESHSQKPLNPKQTFYPQKNSFLPEERKSEQILEKPKTQNTPKDSSLSIFSTMSNLRSGQKGEQSKESLFTTKKPEVKDITNKNIFETKPPTQSNSIPIEKYKTLESESIDEREPYQRVKEWFIIILFVTVLGYICIKW